MCQPFLGSRDSSDGAARSPELQSTGFDVQNPAARRVSGWDSVGVGDERHALAAAEGCRAANSDRGVKRQ